MKIKKNILIFSVAAIILLLDQLTKFLVRKNFTLNESISIINNIFHLTFITNTGSAFGLFKGYNFLFIVFSFVVIGIIFYFLKSVKEKEKSIQAAIGLILAGTFGNLIDRLFYGAVIDFLDFRIWPIFNIADSAVTIGVAMLIFLMWKK